MLFLLNKMSWEFGLSSKIQYHNKKRLYFKLQIILLHKLYKAMDISMSRLRYN